MFKFIIILALVIFLFARLFKFLMKYAIIGMAQKYANQNFQKTTSNPNNSNPEKPGKSKPSTFDNKKKAGDYIDFEVIK